jgi:putative phosphoribosyl transferase
MPAHPARGKGLRRLDRNGDPTRRPSAAAPLGAGTASPEQPIGVIIFPVSALGSASNTGLGHIRTALQNRGFAPLLAELLSPAETEHGYHNLDIDLLAGRIADFTQDLRRNASLKDLPIGYFAMGTDAAAVATAAAQPDCPASAVVLCDARPELASNALALVHAPTLFIVEDDELALHLNRSALARLRCLADLAVLQGPSNSLASPKIASQAARLAGDWFETHLCSHE